MQLVHLATNGVTLHAAVDGPENGPLVILLHGFPEFWYAWRRYIPLLAEAGFRVIAPDQRGYNLSEKPSRTQDYAIGTLAADVLGLIEGAGRDKAMIVGHDWGALVAWWLAMTAPDKVEKLAVMNVPHPLAMRAHMLSSPSQMLKSWYTLFFQAPFLGERVFAHDGGRTMFGRIRAHGRPGAFDDADMPFYLEAWARPGATTAMLNWYRASRSWFLSPPADPGPIQPPTRIYWGKADKILDHQAAELSRQRCRDARVIYFDEASHWVQHEEFARLGTMLLGFARDSER